MDLQLQRGQKVTVNAYGGQTPVVVVVEDRGDTILICRPEEFTRAQAEKRAPTVIGFHKSDVVSS